MHNNRKYLILTATVTINLIVGITYIWSLISKELTHTYGWSARQASLPYMLALATMTFAMIISGFISDHGHPCTSTLLGSVLWGLGLAICGISSRFEIVTVAYGIIFGSGVGFCTGTTTATAVKWFPQESKGLISGIAAGAVGFSSVYMSFVFTALMNRFGLFRSLMLTGIVGSLIMICASLFLASPNRSATVAQHTHNNFDLTWQEMLHTTEFKKLWLIFALGDSGALMLIGSLASIAKIQAGIENATVLVMALNLSNSIGRFLIGSLSDKIGIQNAFRFSLVLQLVNMILFHFYTSFPLLFFGACIAGISFGGLISLLTPSSGMFGTSHLALNGAVVNTAYAAGALIMPYVSAYIVDTTGSYTGAYVAASILLLAACVVTIFYRGEPVKQI